MLSIHRRYLAYGSNMCRAQMAARCPAARLLGVAAIPGQRFLINRTGFATLIAAPGGRAYGLVWALTAEDERSLDGYEGVADGEYRKETMILAGHGEALIYIAAEFDTGNAAPGLSRGHSRGRRCRFLAARLSGRTRLLAQLVRTHGFAEG